MSGDKGFTLIEALSAAVILAISLFVIGVAIYAEFTFINQNREKALATLACQEEVEKVRGLPFDTILTINAAWVAANPPSAIVYLKNAVTTVTVENSYGGDIKRLTVTVRWDSLSGRTLEKSVATLVARNGIDKQ